MIKKCINYLIPAKRSKNTAGKRRAGLIAVPAILAIVIAAAFLAPAARGAGSAEKKFTFYTLRMTSLGGEKESALLVTMRKFARAISKTSGYDIELKYVNDAEMGRAIDTGKADFFVWGSESYSYEKDDFLKDYLPLVSLSVHGKKTHRYCLYANAGSGIKSIADLSGARIQISPYWVGYGHITGFLKQANISTHPAVFFGQVLVSDNMANSFMKLKTGETDAVFDQSDEADYVLTTNSELKGIAPIVCSQEYRNAVVLYRKKMPREATEKIKAVLLKSHRSNDFKEARAMFLAVNMKFVPAEKSDYNEYNDFLAKSWARGDFHAIYDAVSLKGFDEAYAAKTDIFKGGAPEFVEIEKALGHGDFKTADGIMRRFIRKKRDKRLAGMSKRISLLAKGRGGIRTAGRRCPPDMAYIPAGKFKAGAARPETSISQSKLKTAETAAFCIDRYEYPNIPGVRPRSVVKRAEAETLCKAQGKMLPTDMEWEKAARGTDGRNYPWGNKWKTGHANSALKNDGFAGIAPSGSFSRGASPYGVHDMAGNLWEIVLDSNTYPNAAKLKGGEQVFVLKGGSWADGSKELKSSFGIMSFEPGRADNYGFRCVKR